MTVYLAAVRPFPDWKMHWMEVTLHSLELCIFIIAIAIMSGDKSGWVGSWGILALFVGCFGVIVLHTIYIVSVMVVSAGKWVWRWASEKWQERSGKTS
jgi:hypothetical protein